MNAPRSSRSTKEVTVAHDGVALDAFRVRRELEVLHPGGEPHTGYPAHLDEHAYLTVLGYGRLELLERVRTSSSVTLPVTSQPRTLPELSSSLLIMVTSRWLTYGTPSLEGRFNRLEERSKRAEGRR